MTESELICLEARADRLSDKVKSLTKLSLTKQPPQLRQKRAQQQPRPVSPKQKQHLYCELPSIPNRPLLEYVPVITTELRQSLMQVSGPRTKEHEYSLCIYNLCPNQVTVQSVSQYRPATLPLQPDTSICLLLCVFSVCVCVCVNIVRITK